MAKIRIKSEALRELTQELNLILSKGLANLTDLSGRLEGIEEYLECEESGRISAEAALAGGAAKVLFDKLKKHIEELIPIAQEYEKAENENIDIAQSVG